MMNIGVLVLPLLTKSENPVSFWKTVSFSQGGSDT